ncbi:MAG: hypothetical protein E6G67_10340 [Actinobacteria bacterium]|nr:MAG: hypothetical protein E6G67_10340 [Actinomycetota bacterium]
MAEGNSSQPSSAVCTKYLLFISKPTGYELTEREGEPPSPGAEIDVGDESMRFVVEKVGSSPLPGDARPCVFLQGLQR